MRAKPTRVMQTDATKDSASGFGRIKTISRWIRTYFTNLVPDAKTKPVMFAVDSAVRNWLRYCQPKINGQTSELPYLNGLSLNNEAAAASATLQASIAMDWTQGDQVVLSLPELNPRNILCPKKTTALQLKFALLQMNISGELEINHNEHACQELELPFINGENIEARKLNFPITIKKDCLHLLLLAIRFKQGENLCEEKNWKPVGIVGGCYWKEEEEANEQKNPA